ncbi:FecR family protein [Parapedobacter sp. DT-150]|uniref:FecR family protein n=1 Tax=Parapedobacter sp. DT-150 TaxID=3396162 RepID=UPI003F1B4D91
MLNHASRIRVPDRYGHPRREVLLEGEAFFDVVRNEAKPFTVHAGGLEVNVLGTSFNVSGYGDDPTAEVAVVSGKVRVRAGSAGTDWTLTDGEQLVYDKATDRIEKRSLGAEGRSAWRLGQLRFKEERLEDICRVLERRYGVEIRIREAAIGDIRLSLEPRGERIARVMEMLAMAGGFRYEIRQDTITVHR